MGTLRAQLQAIEGNGDAVSRRPAKVFYTLLFLAAAALLFVVAAIWFFNQAPAHNSQELFAVHFQPPAKMEKSKRSPSTETKDSLSLFLKLWGEAEQDYNHGDFPAALEKLNRLFAMPPSNAYSDDLDYLAGLSFLRNEKPLDAISSFEKIKSAYPSEKPWYLALAYLKSGQSAAAKKEFERIAVSDSPFASDAREILQHLK